jgi:excisionase family DNA binding protein
MTENFMDKICIVRRRQQNSYVEPLWGKGMPITLEEPREEKDPMMTMPMTPGASKFIPLSDSEKGTLKIISAIAVDNPSLEEGRVTFNFRLRTEETLKMLKPEQVCQMLQISKTFLVKLVRQSRLRSYKFGRLRRFLLADVIDYLTASEDHPGMGEKKNNEAPGFRPKYSN